MDIFSNIISILFLFVICLVPVLLWGYFFSFSSQWVSRSKFFYWILAGWISTIPILGVEYMFTNIFPSLNIFEQLYFLWDIWSYLSLLFSLFTVIVIISFFFLWVRTIFPYKNGINFYKYLKATGVYITGIIFLLFLFILLWWIENNTNMWWVLPLANTPIFMWYAFNSLKLIIMYYLVIAFLEEGTKYFSFLSWINFSEITGKRWILFALYVALGFAFFENIFYAVHLFSTQWLDSSLVGILFYRSIFSLFIHVLASVILWYFISRLYENKSYSFLQLLQYILAWVGWAIVIHASYDIVLTLWATFLIFFYFIWGYAIVSKLIFSNK